MNEFVGPTQTLNSFWIHPLPNTMDSGATGLLMILSIFQYQPPTNPVYSAAFSQMGHAAFIQVGAQEFQDRAAAKVETTAKNYVRSIGINNDGLAVILGITNTIRSGSLSIDGPKIQSVKTHFSASQGNASIGLGLDFK